MEHWSDTKLTRSRARRALGRQAPLSSATVASWESRTDPAAAPGQEVACTLSSSLPAGRSGPGGAGSSGHLHPGGTGGLPGAARRLLRLQAAARGGAAPEVPTAARRNCHFTDGGAADAGVRQAAEGRGITLAGPQPELHGAGRCRRPGRDGGTTRPRPGGEPRHGRVLQGARRT